MVRVDRIQTVNLMANTELSAGECSFVFERPAAVGALRFNPGTEPRTR
jgi:hypothetical protein